MKITSNDIDKFVVGDKVRVTVNGEDAEGTIKTVPSVVNNSTSLYTVEVIADNSEGKIKGGMAADVEVTTENKNDTISVLKKAVFEEDNKKYVYVVTADNKAKKVEVQTGIETAERIEIKSGVNNKDTIVISGLSRIKDGSKLFTVVKED